MHTPHLTAPRSLTSDQFWAAATMALAVVAAVLAVAGAYEVGAIVALAGIGVGGWSQLVSASTAERFETVTAVGVAVIALAVCLKDASFPSWF